jgi:hypothetical protein
MFKKDIVEKTETLFYVLYFSKNYAVYEIMWKNMMEPELPQMEI